MYLAQGLEKLRAVVKAVMKHWQLLDQKRNCSFVKQDYAPWSHLGLCRTKSKGCVVEIVKCGWNRRL